MQPFWDVLWSDTRALAVFVAPMLLLSIPASAAAALIGAVSVGPASRGRLWRATCRGVVMGTIAALVFSMLIEFALKVEGLANGRTAMLEAATWQLWLAAAVAALGGGFFAARRFAGGDSEKPRRRFSLRQLFIGELVAGLLLGWWAYTRRDEIGQRRALLEWEVLDRDARAIFEHLGWWVETTPGSDEVSLSAAPHHKPVHDESLAPIAAHSSIVRVGALDNRITDRGIKHLRGAQRLRWLYIKSDQVTDEGIASLAELPRLRYLDLQCEQVTGKSLESLARIKSLRYVLIADSQITAAEADAFRAARRDVNLRIVSSQP